VTETRLLAGTENGRAPKTNLSRLPTRLPTPRFQNGSRQHGLVHISCSVDSVTQSPLCRLRSLTRFPAHQRATARAAIPRAPVASNACSAVVGSREGHQAGFPTFHTGLPKSGPPSVAKEQFDNPVVLQGAYPHGHSTPAHPVGGHGLQPQPPTSSHGQPKPQALPE